MLALYAGFFLSIGATDLLPEAHAHPSWRRIALTVLGVAATGGIVFLARATGLLARSPSCVARERAEALAGGVVRAERLVVGVLRVGRDLLGHRSHLAGERVVVGRVPSSASTQLSEPSYAGTSLSKSSWPSSRPQRM